MKYLQINSTSVGKQDHQLIEKVEADLNMTQALPTNGYDYVDLGLPSGNLWATKNIGADTPEDAGLYFQWGDTQGYTPGQVGTNEGRKYFGWSGYKFSINGSSTKFSKYGVDGKTVLDLEDDAAYAYMGGKWRVPTIADFVELFEYTNVTYVGSNRNITCVYDPDDYAIRLTGNSSSNVPRKIIFRNRSDNSKYISIPLTGYILGTRLTATSQIIDAWQAELYPGRINEAVNLNVNWSRICFTCNNSREYGFPIRAVCRLRN